MWLRAAPGRVDTDSGHTIPDRAILTFDWGDAYSSRGRKRSAEWPVKRMNCTSSGIVIISHNYKRTYEY